MEVIIPTQEFDFEFNSARNSPYLSAPSTPRGFGDYYYTSAPTSPSRLSEFYQEFDGFKSFDDFAFDVSQELDETSVSAEDLFDGGMIKPMQHPLPTPQPSSSSKHILDISEQEKIPSVSPNLRLSSRNKNENMDNHFGRTNKGTPERASRGRERNPSLASSSRRAARSVSPLRVSQYPWEEEKQKQTSTEANPSSSSTLTASSSGKGQKKWRLKDFFLFRSASEGRASDKDGLKNYISLFRGAENNATTNGSSSRRRNSTQISAHELHYTANRAKKEELKKKTFLPYKPGFFGRIQFNPAIAMANGFPVYK
ncbi:hypothetical protein LIER_36895 [Lithospermum erythrorhizon]|uniref:Uncharacterized protein n=1 Tax=Lithospermum erythrorhizon TaxID=34254 RepID=A0AAV3PDC3_LITER